MTAWLEYFTEGLRAQLIEVKTKGEKAIKKEVIIEKAGRLNLNERQQKILIYLLEDRRGSVEGIRQRFNLVRRTVQRDLSKLLDLGLIREVAKSKTDPTRYYELVWHITATLLWRNLEEANPMAEFALGEVIDDDTLKARDGWK
jgi:DeoR/GlpR family transcriptional regulator of sugar metabolism